MHQLCVDLGRYQRRELEVGQIYACDQHYSAKTVILSFYSSSQIVLLISAKGYAKLLRAARLQDDCGGHPFLMDLIGVFFALRVQIAIFVQ
ncbi:hypothetical protein BDR04DRAFT_1098372 [Suillus decipiens]|nr:hypothetical protein BDR04DRAFT_1098372 [Suillus decipiens]